MTFLGWPEVFGRLSLGASLSAAEAQAVMDEVFSGSATEAQIGGLLMALRTKGETVEEMTGFVQAMLSHCEPVTVDDDVIDLVGTGGDHLGSVNVTTMAALVTAGAGAKVLKHGNRAASGSVGTADVLEALGVAVDLGATGVISCLEACGFGFCFARRFHPAMRFAGPVRSQLGVPTVFNSLGPLANPGRVKRMLVGVSDPTKMSMMAQVLIANGTQQAWIVSGDDGLDEITTTAPTTVVQLVAVEGAAAVATGTMFDATSVGIRRASMDELRGGDATFNAAAINAVLAGKPGAHRDIAVVNAAAALLVAGLATDLDHGVGLAQASIDSGRAAEVLAGLVAASQAAQAAEAVV